MFDNPIVFVIGAGASTEFGMPSGLELKNRIAKTFDFREGDDRRLLGDAVLYSMLNRDYIDAANELSHIIRGFHFDSIDEVLHHFSSNRIIVELGKVAIAKEILFAERKSSIFHLGGGIKETDHSKIWIPHLLSMAVGSLTREEISSAFSKVTIINFNYDRIFEHFVYHELGTKLRMKEDEIIDTFSNLRMIRPYGRIGPLPWQAEPSLATPFGAYNQNNLMHISKCIRTYTEKNHDNDKLNEIGEAITNARLIVFLGFGFHQQNMNILRAKSSGLRKKAIATVFGIDSENYDNMSMNIYNTVACDQAPILLPRKSAELLLTMKPTIMNPGP